MERDENGFLHGLVIRKSKHATSHTEYVHGVRHGKSYVYSRATSELLQTATFDNGQMVSVEQTDHPASPRILSSRIDNFRYTGLRVISNFHQFSGHDATNLKQSIARVARLPNFRFNSKIFVCDITDTQLLLWDSDFLFLITKTRPEKSHQIYQVTQLDLKDDALAECIKDIEASGNASESISAFIQLKCV